MVELKHDALIFSFPEVHRDAALRVEFRRTRVLSQDDRVAPLPEVARLPLRHVDEPASPVCFEDALEADPASGGYARSEVGADPYDFGDYDAQRRGRCLVYLTSYQAVRHHGQRATCAAVAQRSLT